MWQPVVDRLDPEIQVISIDLLGFGESPKPDWAEYNAKTQARSVAATLVGLKLTRRPVVVGHSLGALVAIELAKRYPRLIRQLILCSPPLYSHSGKRDRQLGSLYQYIQSHPEHFTKIFSLALRYGLITKRPDLTPQNTPTYMASLQASIINQTSLSDAIKLSVDTRIIHGQLDPLVIKKNLQLITDSNPDATLDVIMASHDITGKRYIDHVAKTINLTTKSAR